MATDFKALNLDDNLMPNGSPVSDYGSSYTPSSEFAQDNERGAITDFFVGTINARKVTAGTIIGSVVYAGTITGSQINGGTLTLGGTLNGNGLMEVKNAAGGTVVTVNNQGITVVGGSISVYDTTGTALVIDASGVVSTTQFLSASVQGSGTESTTSDSFSDITGLSITFTLGRSQNVLMFGQFGGSIAAGFLCFGTTRVRVDSTSVGVAISSSLQNDNFTQEIINLAAGTHTLKLQFAVDSGGTLYAHRQKCLVGYVGLGR